jgi:hypothetical protein
VEFVGRDSATNGLTFNCTLLAASFTVSNSVVNGINPKPNQTTGGDGAATGQEIECSVTFTTPFLLPADHYFFVPQVGLSSGTFLWLSAPRPLVPPGTPFAPDLQSWIRNANLDPDWLRRRSTRCSRSSVKPCPSPGRSRCCWSRCVVRLRCRAACAPARHRIARNDSADLQ